MLDTQATAAHYTRDNKPNHTNDQCKQTNCTTQSLLLPFSRQTLPYSNTFYQALCAASSQYFCSYVRRLSGNSTAHHSRGHHPVRIRQLQWSKHHVQQGQCTYFMQLSQQQSAHNDHNSALHYLQTSVQCDHSQGVDRFSHCCAMVVPMDSMLNPLPHYTTV